MQFEIEINGRSCDVSVEREGSRFRVTIGGRTHLVDAARVDERTLSLVFLRDDGRAESHEVGFLEGPEPDELEVYLRAGVVRARVNDRQRRTRRAGHGGESGPAGLQRIVAPMPGKIVRVLVAEGDAVAARQGLVVVEAMKMENELRSPKEGRIKEILVKEGMSVEAGRVLAVVE
jgi:biotin carboxyl carrier protein